MIKKPKGTTFDLLIGTDARNEALVICTPLSNEHAPQIIPSSSLQVILEPYTEIVQVSQFMHESIYVLLVYNEYNQTHHLLCVEMENAKFSLIDTIKFK